MTPYALPNQNSDPYAVALGRNHSGMWFTELATNTIGYIKLLNHTIHRYSIPTAHAQPYGITAGDQSPHDPAVGKLCPNLPSGQC